MNRKHYLLSNSRIFFAELLIEESRVECSVSNSKIVFDSFSLLELLFEWYSLRYSFNFRERAKSLFF